VKRCYVVLWERLQNAVEGIVCVDEILDVAFADCRYLEWLVLEVVEEFGLGFLLNDG